MALEHHLLPQKFIIPIVIAAAITTATVLFFMVILLFSVISLSHGHSTT